MLLSYYSSCNNSTLRSVSLPESCDNISIQSDGAANQAISLTTNNTEIKDHPNPHSGASSASVLLLTVLVQFIFSISVCWR